MKSIELEEIAVTDTEETTTEANFIVNRLTIENWIMNKAGIPDWLLVYFMLQIDFPDGDVKVNKAKFINDWQINWTDNKDKEKEWRLDLDKLDSIIAKLKAKGMVGKPEEKTLQLSLLQ